MMTSMSYTATAEEELEKFRYALLSTSALIAFLFSFFVTILYTFGFFPSNTLYQTILYLYSAVNFASYVLLRKNRNRYYRVSVNATILSSLATFTVMSVSAVYDEFRFVWFFLASFAAFIVGGKRYGFAISAVIVLVMAVLYGEGRIELSRYGMFTFVTALVVLNIFAYLFLKKIENDADLLQHKVAEEVAKRQEQEQLLLRRYRMTNMGEMIDAIAHQWRQPLMQLNMILLNIDDTLESGEATHAYMQARIEELSALTAHMSRTIDDFRNLLRDDKHKTTFRIVDALKEVLGVMKYRLKDIEVRYDESETTLFSHKNELIQVFIILLSNTVEAFEGRIIKKRRIDIGIAEDTKAVRITIEDNAGGFDPRYLGKLFDPYFTTKKQSGGTGLGLYIAKIIVEQNMRGKLSAAQGERGALFSLAWEKRDA